MEKEGHYVLEGWIKHLDFTRVWLLVHNQHYQVHVSLFVGLIPKKRETAGGKHRSTSS